MDTGSDTAQVVKGNVLHLPTHIQHSRSQQPVTLLPTASDPPPNSQYNTTLLSTDFWLANMTPENDTTQQL